MNILVNGRFSKYKTGVGRVIENLLVGLSKLDKKNNYFIFVNPEFKDLFNFDNHNFKVISNGIPASNSLRNHLWTQTGMLSKIRKHNIDLLLLPQINLFLFKRVPTIVIQHDLIEYVIPNQKWFKLAFRKIAFPIALKLADKIITVSENTSNDIQRIFNVNKNKIDTIYNAADNRFKPLNRKKSLEDIKRKYHLTEPFLLYIGTLTLPQKNLIRLIRAFEKIKDRHRIDMVMVGSKGKDSHLIFQEVEKFKLTKRIHFPGYVPDEDLPIFLNAAQAFCFPSLYEGFGLPALEALQCGCPVVTSNTSSLPEVVGDSAFTVNPYDVDEIAQSIDTIISLTPEERQTVIDKGIKQAKKFSWDYSAKTLHDVICSLSKTNLTQNIS